MHDIDEIRRKAMGVLEKEAGGPVAAAKQAGMSHSQWANLRSGAPDSKTGKARGMRKETAQDRGGLCQARRLARRGRHRRPGLSS